MVSYNKSELLKKYDFKEEYDEEVDGVWMYTGYPEPLKRYKISYENFNLPMEESYWWLLQHLKDLGAPMFEKITDVFSTSEQSTHFGNIHTRLNAIQDRASNYLRAISEMGKTLFQQVRGLRLLKQRITMYNDSWGDDKGTRIAADQALKGTWVDLVDGGTQSPASVFGLANKVGFATLPDLFFSAPPMKASEVNDYVEGLDFNKSVKNILKRKLYQYNRWKEDTYEELVKRYGFTLQYLRHHYNSIKMYTDWIRPYMKYIKKLHMKNTLNDTVDIVGSFEGSMLEIEYIAKTKPAGNKDYFGVVLINMQYASKSLPTQNGVIHTGRVDITWRTYAWSQKEIDIYKKMRDEEMFHLVGQADESIINALDKLGDELQEFLKEAGDTIPEKKEENKEEQKKSKASDTVKNAFDPFVSVIKGVGELGEALTGFKSWDILGKNEKEAKERAKKLSQEKNAAKAVAMFQAWTSYKNYKLSHGMLAW